MAYQSFLINEFKIIILSVVSVEILIENDGFFFFFFWRLEPWSSNWLLLLLLLLLGVRFDINVGGHIRWCFLFLFKLMGFSFLFSLNENADRCHEKRMSICLLPRQAWTHEMVRMRDPYQNFTEQRKLIGLTMTNQIRWGVDSHRNGDRKFTWAGPYFQPRLIYILSRVCAAPFSTLTTRYNEQTNKQ